MASPFFMGAGIPLLMPLKILKSTKEGMDGISGKAGFLTKGFLFERAADCPFSSIAIPAPGIQL